MLHWFQKQLVASETAAWIDDCAHWVIDTFGTQAFWQHTELVLPDERYFPEKVSGPEPMAQYILGRVTELAGVADWPWRLCDVRTLNPESPQLLGIHTGQRFVGNKERLSNASAGEGSGIDATGNISSISSTSLGVNTAHAGSAHITPADSTLQVPFVIDQVSKPQDLVASIAQTCAQHILWQSQQTPPGGLDYFEQAAEVLAHFSGFGIMLTNSAYTYRGGCGSCYNPRANRQASLSESESIYTLALFCHLRKESTTEVFKHLKPHLKGSFKLALKQIKNRPTSFNQQPRSAVAPALANTEPNS